MLQSCKITVCPACKRCNAYIVFYCLLFTIQHSAISLYGCGIYVSISAVLFVDATSLPVLSLEAYFIMPNKRTGVPPPLTRFSLPQFLAYVRASGGFLRQQGTSNSPTNVNFMKHFFQCQNPRKVETLCMMLDISMYARHCKPWLVHFLPHFSEWFIIKIG